MSKNRTDNGIFPRMPDEASPFVNHDDPIEYLKDVIKAGGYGGDLTPVVLVYLAATSRVLMFRSGQTPPHVMLKGPSSVGKTYALEAALQHIPSEFLYRLDAGSPRAFIYDKESIQYKAVVFAERDSLPIGDTDGDNPAASAIRSLLQEGRFNYRVTVTRPGDRPETQVVEKIGPAVFITTGTRSIPGQLGTRILTFEMKDDNDQLTAALNAVAEIELSADDIAKKPDAALLAFQSFIQNQSPIRVKVPFAAPLSSAMQNRLGRPRVLRDLQKIISLIKTIALIRQGLRQRDIDGTLIAELDDYETVVELASPMFASSSTGVSQSVRILVGLVQELGNGGTVTLSSAQAATKLNWNRDKAKRAINTALKRHFLEDRRPYPRQKNTTYLLAVGDPLPPEGGLPSASEVRDWSSSLKTEGPKADPLVTPSEKASSIELGLWDPSTPINDHVDIGDAPSTVAGGVGVAQGPESTQVPSTQRLDLGLSVGASEPATFTTRDANQSVLSPSDKQESP